LCQLLLQPSRQGHVFELFQTIFFLGEASREEVHHSRGPNELRYCVRWGDGWQASREVTTEAAGVLFGAEMKRKQERREPDQTADRMSFASGRSQ